MKHDVSKKIRDTKTPKATQNEHVLKFKHEYQKTKERPRTSALSNGTVVNIHCKWLVCHRRLLQVLSVHKNSNSIHVIKRPKKRKGSGRYDSSHSLGLLLLITGFACTCSMAASIVGAPQAPKHPSPRYNLSYHLCCILKN